MKPIPLQQVASMAEGLLISGNPHQLITSVHFDSRQLEKGGLFIPVVGERDGHDFFHHAVEKGAAAAFISDEAKIPKELPEDFGLILVNDTVRAFEKWAGKYRKQYSLPFIAVTGSNGKTTTKDITAHLLADWMSVYKTYKSFNNHLGVPYSLLQIEEGHQVAVLELGMNHAGEIDRLASLVQPKISIITNIGDAHIEYFGSRRKIALAKAELLPHTATDGLVLLNGDSPYLSELTHLYDGRTLFYSIQGPADLWAEKIETDEQGTSFVVCFASGESFPVSIPLFGKHNVSNALPAIAVARELGMDTAAIAKALSTVFISAMRFQVTPTASGTLVINDAYNANPTSMKAAIETFAEIFPQRKKVLVLGEMLELGAESPDLHAEVGAYADRYSESLELLITIGEATRPLHNAYHGRKLHVPSKEAATDALDAINDAEHAVLFKASRGIRLETLAEHMQQKNRK
ncbi:UDP-N-acetylmuramoyl-tripeptide--D-alanyl-D-alanine ligase [Brevibacillus humidisoli]|uniref:UDP-N-acetylmuramoyl-tripeptide--D-alanyl-D- alanine ligase n=1 Tax=Brevibacillus humidisoli TaxID=2895522 RepID=UPI001E3937DD|nr:UDP-N-acetylmuramoyl-tripeptide--D-alanyl-D-alanine ligase [Brevibacillus humidisoli]UFJ43159.1 UDP-N-acetylmuramoyl-tripeptide--D-alanyl-D-alanine ligase [Brevibacillus humidisoli]